MKIRKLAILTLGLSLSLTGCGSRDRQQNADTPIYNNGFATDEIWKEDVNGIGGIWDQEMAPEEAPGAMPDRDTAGNPDGSGTTPVPSAQKLIRRVYTSYETKEYDKAIAKINELTMLYGGYVENSNVSGKSELNPNTQRSASYTLRIPSGNLDTFLGQMAGVGTLIRQNETSEDVTLNYVSVQSHIDALSIEYERLLEMLKKADDVKTMMAIENQLTDIRYQLQYYESQKRTYDNLVDYSTVSVQIQEVKNITIVEPEKELGYWEQLREDFQDNLAGIGEWFADLFHDIVVVLPQLLTVLVIAGVALGIVIKKCSRKRKLSPEAANVSTEAPQEEKK